MRSLIQRVSWASVCVEGQIVGAIEAGLLVFLGLEREDTEADANKHTDKLLKLRIFADDAGKMNRSVSDIGGGLLIVSQFTLAGDCRKGNRPGFDSAMAPTEAKALYTYYVNRLRETAGHLRVETGIFAAHMAVSLHNDGPVTFLLENL
ncbi:MAG: D-aminoacyl-tRNA deacylase [Candidatus Melainabacteria bacterium]|nr:D-aminoacyl-tRNA deacylase [Candidatus Melainabacteria bacterium]